MLDGHVRLAAALEEGRAPPLLAVMPARTRAAGAADGEREALLEAVQSLAARGGVDAAHANRVLVGAFDDATRCVPRQVAWPLPGGEPAWRGDVRAQLASLQVDADMRRALLA